MISPKKAVASLDAYSPGGPQDGARLINLAANENILGPSPATRAPVASAALSTYPDARGRLLLERLAAMWSLDEAFFLLGTGSGHLLKLVAETYLDPGDTVIVPQPTFSLYDSFSRLQGAVIRHVPVGDLEGTDLKGVRLVFLCSPNNPTGTSLPAASIDRLLRRLPENAALVWDQAYFEFAGDGEDGARWIRQGRPLIITRTFSKLYGLASARVGYLVADPAITGPLALAREPFPVGTLGLELAARALEDTEHTERYLALVRQGRAELTRALRGCGYTVHGSDANFILVETGTFTGPAKEALAAAGYLVRDAASFGLSGHLRITIGRKTHMADVARILRRVRGAAKE